MTKFVAEVIERSVASLKPYARNARTHSKKQIKQIAWSIERFGFVNPVLIGDGGEIIAGHGRVDAAKQLGLRTVPTLALSHLTKTERRAYALADNKLALNAGWDREILAIDLQGLVDLDFDVELTGFSLAEIDFVLDEAGEADPDAPDAAEDAVPDVTGPAVSRMGDVWILGRHKLVCGDARSSDDYARLLGNERVDMVFTDPSYNVAIDGNVCGLGSVKHREFAFASGEMSEMQFTQFLEASLGAMASVMRDGAIAFVCMDWRHMGELLAAGNSAFTELKNLVVWNKTNGGMGAFYRSKHELIFVFKQGTAPHTNSFGLGETGRYPTNVWDYAGISSISASRGDEAYRPVIIREGDKSIELPAIQASVRALAISAMKGSRLAQKQLSDIVRTVEARKYTDQLETLEVMIEYKQKWTAELERRQRRGVVAPDPVPHPDDIFVDLIKGNIEFDGPIDEKQKEFWDERFQRMTDSQESVTYFADKYRKARDPKRKALWREEWHYEQRLFDLMNDSLPKKHKRKLVNRSYAPDASREGKTLDEFRRNRKMRNEYVG